VLQELPDLPCRFLCRVQANAADEVQAERPGSAAAQAAGVGREAVLRRWGTAPHGRLLPPPCRVLTMATGQLQTTGTPEVMVLGTNRLDRDAALVALAYRDRWAVALFCRWIKGGLGCRHLLSQRENGVRFQGYGALIARLRIRLWVGRAPTKRTYEMLCLYLTGGATAAELIAHMHRLHLKAPPPCKK
jgi:hypothetical protein